MGRFSKKLHQVTAKWIDIPQDVVSDIPRLTMIGNNYLTVENHRGVIHFAGDLVTLAIPTGEMQVIGEQFVIREISTEEVLIEGVIQAINYQAHGKR